MQLFSLLEMEKRVATDSDRWSKVKGADEIEVRYRIAENSLKVAVRQISVEVKDSGSTIDWRLQPGFYTISMILAACVAPTSLHSMICQRRCSLLGYTLTCGAQLSAILSGRSARIITVSLGSTRIPTGRGLSNTEEATLNSLPFKGILIPLTKLMVLHHSFVDAIFPIPPE